MHNLGKRIHISKTAAVIFVVCTALTVVLVINFDVNLFSPEVTDTSCKEKSQEYLSNVEPVDGPNVINAGPYPFERCSQKTLQTETGEELRQLKIVTGEVEERWEFECGFNAACRVYFAWVDEAGNFIDLGSAPKAANNDPAVYSVGCGYGGSGSFKTTVNPTLVYERGDYWWRIDYSGTEMVGFGTASDTQELTYCVVDGTSLVQANKVLSNIEYEYRFDPDNCGDFPKLNCRIARALQAGDTDQCKLSEKKYDYTCIVSYISQTGVKGFCGATIDSIKVDCSKIPKVMEL